MLSFSYNPQISSSLTIPTIEFRLDIRTIAMIGFSCILYLNDSHLVDLNPTYAAQLNSTDKMITQVLGCGSTLAQAPVINTVANLIYAYQVTHPEDLEYNNCINSYPPQLYYDYYNCISTPWLGVYYAPTETTVPPLVLGTAGAMGAMVVNGDSSYGIPTMVVERGGVKVDTTSDVGSLAACAQGTFDATTLTFDTDNPINVTCWPWCARIHLSACI